MSAIAVKLRDKLLSALESNGENLIGETVRAIQSTLDCDMCTLWTINHNNTDSEIGKFASASLLMQCLSKGSLYSKSNREYYVHPLKGSFFEYVLKKTSENGNKIFQCDLNNERCEKHLFNDSLKRMGGSFLVCFPIKEDEKKETYAFIKIAYKKQPSDTTIFDEEIANTINKAIVSAISHYHIYQKQQLLDELIKNFNKNKLTLKDVFFPVIHRIIRHYFDYEGASVFIWNSFSNRYDLLVTEGMERFEVNYYKNGEGWLDMIVSQKTNKIYDNWEELAKNVSQYLPKYKENVIPHGITLLTIPILSPSNPDKVLGIVLFVNKINKFSKRTNDYVLDFFNDKDVDLIENAFHYLAMIVENHLSAEDRQDFITKMSHDFKTPTNAIRITAERALRKFKANDSRFMQSQFEHYMQSIIDYTGMQIMQLTTNMFITKPKRNYRSGFNIGNYSIVSIIKESIDSIKSFARECNFLFNKIRIADDFPDIALMVDKNAFKTVFYNLLTNAIKYRVPDGDFQVLFSAKENLDYLIINVSDIGIGVALNDAERIFLLGIRGENARRTNAEGYGIGLYVIKQILEAFGGEIRLSNNQNPTTFEIKLPHTLYA